MKFVWHILLSHLRLLSKSAVSCHVDIALRYTATEIILQLIVHYVILF